MNDHGRARIPASPDQERRLMELGMAVGSVAHELRNPLASLTLGLDLLRIYAAEVPEEQRVLRQAQAGVRRISDLVEELMDYVQERPPVFRPCEVGGLVRSTVEACAHLSSHRQVEVRTEGSAELWAFADPRRLYQAVRNLLENAVQHAPPHSAVRVRFRTETATGIPGCALEVEDEGPGLGDLDPARLFEPFYTRRPGGTGLGLAIARRAVQAHSGTLEAETRAEGGARFTLWIPATPPDRPGQD